MKRKSLQGDESTDDLALDVLLWIVAEEDRLLPFLSATGVAPQDLRERVRDPAFLAAVLDHVMGDENVLLACARGLAVAPERIAAAWRRACAPPDFDDG